MGSNVREGGWGGKTLAPARALDASLWIMYGKDKAVTEEQQDVPMPRDLQDTIDDLFGLVEAWEDYAKAAESPEESKRCYMAAGCTRDAIRLIRVLYARAPEIAVVMQNRR